MNVDKPKFELTIEEDEELHQMELCHEAELVKIKKLQEIEKAGTPSLLEEEENGN